MRAPYRLVLLVLLGVLLTACGVGSGPDRPDEPEGSAGEIREGVYVALGDSAASGMGIAPERPGDICRRSARAYPVLLAQRNGLELVNRTCAGARVIDVIGGPGSRGDAPVDALDEQTTLVTVMVGANDLGYAGLVSADCADGAADDSCSTTAARAAAGDRLQAFASELRVLLETIDERAPQAEVLVVGYGDALGAAGPCPAMPLTQDAFDLAVATVRELNVVLQEAAEEAGAAYVDTYAATRGHGVCDAEPWTNGFTTDGDGAIGHPRSDYHAAVAELLVEIVS
ncbi:SGNH/GDSL hydrolase family protein [Nocardioides massiliensis]|uniref:Lysophospholipase L1-like esterase n=1 Tax=Nocardioides massiliensis TaxID=1325935 RepID=A0ABT9NMW9_9ACTN|nr:SGNH/GDSL hydrolase family protein [Nocardioides massiliensis]MDP9821768.1 lysophospholipase L1-like esterase [Nocardioides massiliensis]